MVSIRPATEADLAGIEAIYNHYVLHSTATFQTEAGPFSDREAWFKAHGARHPVLAAVDGSELVGWGSLSPFHRRAAYGNTVESSVYIREGFHRRGIGALMLAELIRLASASGHHTIVAIIAAEQAPSIALHKKFGFKDAALLREVGFKFGRWLDVTYMQLMLPGEKAP